MRLCREARTVIDLMDERMRIWKSRGVTAVRVRSMWPVMRMWGVPCSTAARSSTAVATSAYRSAAASTRRPLPRAGGHGGHGGHGTSMMSALAAPSSRSPSAALPIAAVDIPCTRLHVCPRRRLSVLSL